MLYLISVNLILSISCLYFLMEEGHKRKKSLNSFSSNLKDTGKKIDEHASEIDLLEIKITRIESALESLNDSLVKACKKKV